ncbi:MAG: DUF5789 family protein [Halobacteriales archaeon]
MRPNDAYDRFASTFEYPVSHEEIIEAVGETAVRSPNGTDETIGDILARSERSEFRSAQDLHETFLSTLGEEYIGRKYYDDRGCNIGQPRPRTM